MNVEFDDGIFTRQVHGGISRYFIELSLGLSRRGEKVKFLAPFHVSRDLSGAFGVGIRVPHFRGLGPLIRGFNRHVNQVRLRSETEVGPRIFHETYYGTSLRLASNVRHVVTVHDMTHERFPGLIGKRDRTAALKKIAVEGADHIICVSESTKADLIEILGVNENKVDVVYHGVTKLPEVSENPERVANGWPFLLYVGQRGGYKNFYALASAYARVDGMRDEMKLVCFGGGKWTSEEKRYFVNLGLDDSSVFQLGGTDQTLAQLYRDAIALVYPSLYEGFGLPLLEAMSQGCPVLCSDTPALREIADRAALYFDPESEDDLRSQLSVIASSESLRASLCGAGKRRSSEFSWEKCVNETCEVYASLL